MLQLRILIVGGGLGGLCASIALRQKGFEVEVFEAAPQLGEIGAGIQVPPNSVRHLKTLGVYDQVSEKATWPAAITIKQWKDGSKLGETPLRPSMERAYGHPYFLIHRADLHAILHARALDVGVLFHVNSAVKEVDENGPFVLLRDGHIIRGDVIIGADGVKSVTRSAVIGSEEVKLHTDLCYVYRCLVPGKAMHDDPELRHLMDDPNASWWVGPGGHIMAYPIRGGDLYNFNLSQTGSMPSGVMTENASSQQIIDEFKDWDPLVAKIVSKISGSLRWQLLELGELQQWVSNSGKVALIGDSAHAMLPYLAQGAAMAIEDAVVIAECLAATTSWKDISRLLNLYEKLRKPRVRIITRGARKTVDIWHLPDGPEQEARDAKLEVDQVVQEPAGLPSEITENPNFWSDASFQPWLLGFDARADSRKQIRLELERKAENM